MKEEIKELEEGMAELAELMLETQREMLAWEKKIKLAIETKHNIQKERSSSGEMGQMKLEIHRMEVTGWVTFLLFERNFNLLEVEK